MIIEMRNGLKTVGWIWYLIAAMFVVPPFINGMRIFMAKLDSVATVNGINVRKKDFHRTKRSHDAYIKSLASMGLGQFAKPMSDADVLRSCALAILEENAADKIGIEVSGQCLAEAVAKGLARHSLEKDGSLDYRRYASSVMASAGMTIAEYEHNQLIDLKTEALHELIKQCAYNPKFAFEHKKAVASKDKKFKVIEFPLKNFLSFVEKEELSPEQLDLFYRENSKNYMTKQERSLSYAFFKRDLFGQVSLPDAFDAEEYYERHMSEQFSTPEKFSINYLVAEFDSEEQKKELSNELELIVQNVTKSNKKLSSATKNSKIKADKKVDFSIGKSDLPYPLEMELENKKEIGAITKVVEAQGKLYVAQIDQYTAFSIKPFEQVKDEIFQIIKKQKVDELIRDEIGSMIKEARELENGSEILDREIERYGLKKKNLTLKQDDEPTEGLESKLYKLAYDKNVYQGHLGYLNHEDGLVVFVVTEIISPELMPFDAVAKEVKRDFLEKQASSTQESAVEEVRQRIVASEKLDDKLATWNLKEVSTEWVSKGEKDIRGFEFGARLIEELCTLERPVQVIKHKDKDSYFLISLEAQREPKDHSKTDQAVYDCIDYQATRDTLDGFIACLLKDAKIVPNKNVLTDLIPEF